MKQVHVTKRLLARASRTSGGIGPLVIASLTGNVGMIEAFQGMLRFFAVLLTGLALIAPGAHLYEIANKIALSKPEYFVVQKIYIGWWMAGILLPLSLLANLLLAYSDKSLLALGAAGLVLANLVIFYFFTYPVTSPPKTGRSCPTIGKR